MGGPTPSQTIGPFFSVGLPLAGNQVVDPASAGAVRLQGQVVDGTGAPVSDALLEIWSPAVGFGRCPTDSEGAYGFVLAKPPATQGAPAFELSVHARGLMRQLRTRVYFPDEEAANQVDPVLQLVEPDRRQTLVARRDGAGLRFDIRLQGEDETVFFAI